jgi:lauroyl/myristoyl acyltransferase
MDASNPDSLRKTVVRVLKIASGCTVSSTNRAESQSTQEQQNMVEPHSKQHPIEQKTTAVKALQALARPNITSPLEKSSSAVPFFQQKTITLVGITLLASLAVLSTLIAISISRENHRLSDRLQAEQSRQQTP